MSTNRKSRFRVRFAPPSSKTTPATTTSASDNATSLALTPSISSSEFVLKLPDCTDGKQGRSRLGCKTCRKRRVKCDETFPVCLKCQQRGEFCEPPSRARPWQLETSVLLQAACAPGALDSTSQPDQKLLRYWLERASQIMALDPDNNPMSFPILKLIERSTSLIHALQSVGAAHQNFFNPSKLNRCLEERSLAMQHVRREIQGPTKDVPVLFLTVFLLGLSSFWTAGYQDDRDAFVQAQAHFLGGRALIDVILALPPSEINQQMRFAIGAYMYWDMACCFVIEPDVREYAGTERLTTALRLLGNNYHPILGYSAEMACLLADLGRYCRSAIETGEGDPQREALFEEQLNRWEPNRDSPELSVLGDAYRYHGLINLHVVRWQHAVKSMPTESNALSSSWQPIDELPWMDLELNTALDTVLDTSLNTGLHMGLDTEPDAGLNMGLEMDFGLDSWLDLLPVDPDLSQNLPYLELYDDENDSVDTDVSPTGNAYTENTSTFSGRSICSDSAARHWEATIRDLCLRAVSSLGEVPESHPCTNLHGIPLLSAGCGLAAEDSEERDLVRKRFRALYSLNHLPSNLRGLELLEELWQKRDAGEITSWLTLMQDKGWHLMLG